MWYFENKQVQTPRNNVVDVAPTPSSEEFVAVRARGMASEEDLNQAIESAFNDVTA